MGGDWLDDFTGGWAPPEPPPRPPAAAEGDGRESVLIVVCRRCRSRDVRCTRRTETHGHWSCAACLHGWKEPPDVGQSGRGCLA